ncbi:phosphoribosyltransferase family protein, partial [Streptomyces calidiresistens]
MTTDHDPLAPPPDPAGTPEPAGIVPPTGEWVARRLGLRLHPAPPGSGDPDRDGPDAPDLRDLIGLAVRRNPRRAHLLVSTVLGKHIPRSPAVVHGTAVALGRRVRALLGDRADGTVVLGYAETATALGHGVADGIGDAVYLHSTRRAVPGIPPAAGFEEEHSHHTSHLLLPADPDLLDGTGPLVLVDDELSTGRTLRNTITALHARRPRDLWVAVTLTDLRGPADVAALEKTAAELGTRIEVVALARGTVELPDDVLERGRALVAEEEARVAASAEEDTGPGDPGTVPGLVRRVDPPWPAGLPDGGRHGFTPADRRRLEALLPSIVAPLADALPIGARRVLVLGTEEFMYVPLRIAGALEEAFPSGEGPEVLFSTTTRSPVLPIDDPGYAIRSRLVFPAHDLP